MQAAPEPRTDDAASRRCWRPVTPAPGGEREREREGGRERERARARERERGSESERERERETDTERLTPAHSGGAARIDCALQSSPG